MNGDLEEVVETRIKSTQPSAMEILGNPLAESSNNGLSDWVLQRIN